MESAACRGMKSTAGGMESVEDGMESRPKGNEGYTLRVMPCADEPRCHTTPKAPDSIPSPSVLDKLKDEPKFVF